MGIKNSKTNEVRFQGLVLNVRGTFRMDTSMDEVLIWNPETESTSIEYIMGNEWATVDASNEVVQKYYKSIEARQVECDQINLDRKAKSLQIGTTIKVVKGRKVTKGTVAKIKSINKTSQFTMLFLDNGQVTYSQNVLVKFNGTFVEPETYFETGFFFQAVKCETT